MDDKHIGSVISTETKDGSVYQGKLTTLDTHNGSVTMANVIKDGLPLHRCITLSTSDITSLKVIRAATQVSVPVQIPPQKPAVSSKKHRPQKQSSESTVSSVSATSSSLSSVPTSSTNRHSMVQSKSKGKTQNKSCVEKLFEQHSTPTKTSSKRNNRQSPKLNGFSHVTEEISETPLFKNFEPQVPNPKVLSALTPNGGKCSKKQGPSGNPVLDALNHYKGIGGRNKNDLAEPIDFDLDSDFDFDGNLKLFAKDQTDDDYYENVEKLKVSQNFAHYENIIEDENRVTSWTNLKARSDLVKSGTPQKMEKTNFQVTGVSFEKSMNGDPVPAISLHEKKEFLNECKSSLGEAVYDTVVADRIFQWTSEIQASHGDTHGTIVILASATNSVRSIRRLLTHFDKRRYNCHLFGKYPGEHFEHVNVVDSVKQLPREVPIICILSPEVNDDVECWLRAQSNGISSHYICIENVPSILEPSRCHLLQFGCATNGLRHVERKVKAVTRGGITFETLCQGKLHEETSSVLIDSAIADLGSPSNWFDEVSARFIATAFATNFLIRLSRST